MPRTDVLIIGGGIAALTAAHSLSVEKNVIVITKSDVKASNSFHAQGGVAATIHKDDHWRSHYEDTMLAGCYHNNEENVQTLVQKGRDSMIDLIHQGMHFDRDTNGELHFGMEGAHSRRRIVHAGGDATGKALITFMLRQLTDKVTIIENEMALDLIMNDAQCIGVTTKDANDRLINYYASSTIIATGGCGGVYATTSNDPTVTGDGMAMVYRAGAVLADLEFMQFHPTLLYGGGKGLGLISEAVRGEGAYLIDNHGERLMDGVHELKDLAPRDVVAREIFGKLYEGKQIYLDIAHVKQFSSRFPTIYQLCMDHDIDISKNKLPVIPGAHFMMGGIVTDGHGRTSVSGLYAIGEAACTGVHGANRIASNSLLEGMVFGDLAAKAILDDGLSIANHEYKQAVQTSKTCHLPSAEELKEKMLKHVGVVRTDKSLRVMKSWLEGFNFLHANLCTRSIREVEVINMLTVSWLITISALERTESRGGHYRSDYPQAIHQWLKKRIQRHVSEHNIILAI